MIFDVLENHDPSVFSFTATTPGAIELPVGGTPLNGEPLFNGADNSWFQPGDNVLLQFIRAGIPFGFGQGSGQWVFGFQWVDHLNNFFPAQELGPSSSIFLPNGCGPLVFPGGGLFLKIPPVAPLKLQLRITVSAFNVSMINLPDILDGVEVGTIYNLGVVHTLPLLVGF